MSTSEALMAIGASERMVAGRSRRIWIGQRSRRVRDRHNGQRLDHQPGLIRSLARRQDLRQDRRHDRSWSATTMPGSRAHNVRKGTSVRGRAGADSVVAKGQPLVAS